MLTYSKYYWYFSKEKDISILGMLAEKKSEDEP